MIDTAIFENTEIAFAYKPDKELKKAHNIFTLIGMPWLVRIGSSFTLLAVKMRLPIKGILKHTLFSQFCGGENVEQTLQLVDRNARYNVKSILDYATEGIQSEERFEQIAHEIKQNIHIACNHPAIPFAVFKPSGIVRFGLLEKLASGGENSLTQAEKEEWKKARNRFFSLFQEAYNAGVRIFVDAEEVWIQSPIDDLLWEATLTFNKNKAIIFNTLQMYRKDRIDFLKQDIAKARTHKVFLGYKFVRGAYMEKERERAAKMGYPSPIHNTKQQTDESYNEALRISVENDDIISLCNATHNEKSCYYLMELMDQKGIAKNDERYYFAQLLGMSDHISYNLASMGYNVAKYVPYGDVFDVIPYLIRRAQENTSIEGQQSRELQLIKKELRRRLQKNH